MRPHLFHARTGSPPVRLATALALLATVCSLALLLQSNRADASIAAKQDALASVRDKQASVADQVASANQQINDLIGQVSEARQREAAAAAQLAEAQKELATASNQLADGRAHLRDVREQLRRATDELKKILVGVYKSDDPNLVKLLLDSSRWEDAGIDAAYLNRIHEYQANTVQRVTDLRAEAADTVDQLAAAKQRISEQRDAIAARQQQLADVRAGLEAQESQLAAARAARKQTLSTLASRETSLQSGIDQAQARQARAARRAASKITPPIPEAAPSGPTVAAPAASAPAPAPSGSTATLNSDGSATAPADAPAEVKAVIAAANQIKDAPYVWGGGHGSFDSSRLRLLGRRLLRTARRRLPLRSARLHRPQLLGRVRPRQLDHGLRQLRPRLRGDRRAALGHLRNRRLRSELEHDHLELRGRIGVHRPPPSWLLI